MDLFAVCSPGLEPVLSGELQALGLSLNTPEGPCPPSSEETSGGVGFRGTLPDLYRVNVFLRTASRVLMRLGTFPAVSFAELRRKAAGLFWEHFLSPGTPVAFRVTCHRSRLYHQKAVAERLAGAIGDRLGKPVSLEKWDDRGEDQSCRLILVRLVDNHCTISLDSSGSLLHRRGYRLAGAKAPLRETLAAGLLLASGWDGSSPLVDPFCGSGTIPIEAALLAQNRPPGVTRNFAFMDWPGFDPALWRRIRSEAEAAEIMVRPPIWASDRDQGAVRSARENAERAGVADRIAFRCRAVSAVESPPGPGWVVTNPPYGVRISGGKDLRNLYARFGQVLRTRCPGWRVAFLCPDRVLAGHTGLTLQEAFRVRHGGLAVRGWLGKVGG